MKRTIFFLATLLFLSLPARIYAWSEWYVPNRFAGMFYDSSVPPGNNWSNVTNLAILTDLQYATVNAEFSNPSLGCNQAPCTWYQSFGFSAPELVGNTITKIELDVRMRRRYNVSPTETVWAYIVSPDGDVITALNATKGDFYTIPGTGWSTFTFKWEDDAPPDDRVSKYLTYFDDYNFTVVLGVSKNGTSGSTNFVDISQMQIRFETTETALSALLPADISKVDIAIENLQDTLNAKAPFAYFNAITGLDFSPVATETAQFTFPVPYPSGTVYYPMVVPQEMYDILSGIRWLIRLAIIGTIILYFMRLSDRTI